MFSFALFGFSYVFSCFFTICRILSHCFFVAFLPVLIFVLSMRDVFMNYIWIHFDEKLSELIGFYSGVNKNILVSPFALVFFHMYFVLFTCKSLVREITK